jgi:uncharacterized protein (TIGR02284 family)
MKHRYTIVTLTELLTVTRDGGHGFTLCADHSRSADLKRMFASRARRNALIAVELSEVIAEFGGDPAVRSRIIGATRRGWVNLQSALTLNSDDALVAECERGEDHALEVYRNALDDHLPDFVRTMILRQFEDMMSDHDQIRFLRGDPLQGGLLATSTGGDARQ